MTNIAPVKIKYFSLQNRSFGVGDRMLFNLYINKEKKAHLLYTAKQRLTQEQHKILEAVSKVYIKREDFKACQKYFQNKKEHKINSYEEQSFESLTSSIRSYLKHIYTNSADAKVIKKLYPLVSHLTTLIINQNANIQELMHLIEKDYHTYSHSLNVAIYAALLGKEIDLTKATLKKLVLSAVIHDIGKTKIDEKILYKKEPLNAHELKIVKMHATMGYTIAKNAGILDKDILSGIHHHHERLDGSGYPNRFKNGHISQFARIIAICDTYAAMSSNRAHKASQKPFEILSQMKHVLKGKLDGDLLNHFIKVLT